MKGEYLTTTWKFHNLQGFRWKTTQPWLSGQELVFPSKSFAFPVAVAITTFEIQGLTFISYPYFQMLYQFLSTKIIFPKKFFVFTESIILIHFSWLTSCVSCNLCKDWGVSLGPPHFEHTCNSLKTLQIYSRNENINIILRQKCMQG